MPTPESPPPPLNPEQPVQCYRNLNRRCWSIKQGGRVVAHLESLSLSDVRMTVRAAGRERVRRTRQKNVHAWVDGFLCSAELPQQARHLSYDPYNDDTFKADGMTLSSAQFAHFTAQGKAFIWT